MSIHKHDSWCTEKDPSVPHHAPAFAPAPARPPSLTRRSAGNTARPAASSRESRRTNNAVVFRRTWTIEPPSTNNHLEIIQVDAFPITEKEFRTRVFLDEKNEMHIPEGFETATIEHAIHQDSKEFLTIRFGAQEWTRSIEDLHELYELLVQPTGEREEGNVSHQAILQFAGVIAWHSRKVLFLFFLMFLLRYTINDGFSTLSYVLSKIFKMPEYQKGIRIAMITAFSLWISASIYGRSQLNLNNVLRTTQIAVTTPGSVPLGEVNRRLIENFGSGRNVLTEKQIKKQSEEFAAFTGYPSQVLYPKENEDMLLPRFPRNETAAEEELKNTFTVTTDNNSTETYEKAVNVMQGALNRFLLNTNQTKRFEDMNTTLYKYIKQDKDDRRTAACIAILRSVPVSAVQITFSLYDALSPQVIQEIGYALENVARDSESETWRERIRKLKDSLVNEKTNISEATFLSELQTARGLLTIEWLAAWFQNVLFYEDQELNQELKEDVVAERQKIYRERQRRLVNIYPPNLPPDLLTILQKNDYSSPVFQNVVKNQRDRPEGAALRKFLETTMKTIQVPADVARASKNEIPVLDPFAHIMASLLDVPIGKEKPDVDVEKRDPFKMIPEHDLTTSVETGTEICIDAEQNYNFRKFLTVGALVLRLGLGTFTARTLYAKLFPKKKQEKESGNMEEEEDEDENNMSYNMSKLQRILANAKPVEIYVPGSNNMPVH